MTNRPKRTPHRNVLPTIGADDLAAVSGGINWKYQFYRAGIAISQWDPSMVAANFIM